MREQAIPESELHAVAAMFENLAPLTVPDGIDPRDEYRTMFTTVMCSDSKVYYIKGENNHRVNAVKVKEIPTGEIKTYTLEDKEDVKWLG